MKNESQDRAFIHQPHDKLVKRLLSRPDTARDILSLHLPEEVMSIVDLNTLELQRDSFVDDEHRNNAVDLLYKTRFQEQEGYIWILLEHQRKSDYWMPVRLFKYIAIIWDHIRKTSKSKDLPLIYPLVIYNGTHSYEHSLSLSELIQPEVARKIFDTLFTQPFCLVDLTTIPDEKLRQAASEKIKGVALLMTLKHKADQNARQFFEQTLINVLRQLDAEGDSDEVADIIYYLLNEGMYPDAKQFWMAFQGNFSREVENKMTTVLEEYMEVGRKEGLQQGLDQGIEQLLQTAKRLFDENKTLGHAELIAWVHRMTGLPAEKLKNLLIVQGET